MNILSRSDTDFFLTGGTALSRAYYNHRYSDDLDFFVNHCQTYDEQLDKILDMLKEDGFVWSIEKEFTRAEAFTTLKVGKNPEVLLKLDFVNDMVPIFGEIKKTNLFYRTDSIRNILSNKLSAIFRFAAKDVADIREIALHETVDWGQAINDTRQKEAGIDLTYIGEILTGMPQREFDTIAWVKKPDWEEFRNDINRIVFDMISGA
jgi:predicted nucleotidyltransferase component of viral defense system